MKKLLLLFLLCSHSQVNAQSILALDSNMNPVSALTINVSAPQAYSYYNFIRVINTASVAKTYKVQKTVLTSNPGSLFYFAFELHCYNSTVVLSLPATVNAGDTTALFPYFYDDTTLAPYSCSVLYCIYDVNNPSDDLCITINYNAVPAGIAAPQETVQLRAFPLPASDHVTIRLDADSRKNSLRIVDATGRVVEPDYVEWRNGEAEIGIASLPSGLYALMVEEVVSGNRIAAARIVRQ